jgi:WD40 repeat protein
MFPIRCDLPSSFWRCATTLSLILLVAAVLPGCTPPQSITPTPRAPTISPAPATTTPTIRPSDYPTSTPTPTFTQLPTDTPTPLPTGTPTPTPTPAVISAHNAAQVRELARLGRGYANDLAISPDGSTIAVAGSLGIWLLDAATLQPLRLLEGHAGAALSVDWSPDGARLVSGGEDGTLRVWDVATGDILFVHHPYRSIYGMSVAWSPDGRQIASRHETGLYVWEADSGELVRAMQAKVLQTSQYGQGVAWSPDSARLATLDEHGQLQVWEVESEELLYEVSPGGKLTGYGVAWSPDGQWIAAIYKGLVSGDITGIVYMYDAANGARVRAIHQQYGNFTSLSWSPDGTRLITPGDVNSISVWDASTGRQLLRLEGHTAKATTVDWSPDGGWLVSAGVDGVLRIWDAATGELRQTATGLFLGKVRSLAWSPDGSRLASGGEDETVRLWDMAQMPVPSIQHTDILSGPQSYVNAVAWLADGQTLLSGGGEYTLYAWDASGQKKDAIPIAGGVEEMACSPDGRQCVVSGLGTGTTRWVDLATGEAVEMEGKYGSANAIAWSPDGRWIAFGGGEFTVSGHPEVLPGAMRLWDTLDQREVVLPCDSQVIFSVAWSPDGKRLAAGGYRYEDTRNVIHLWNVPEGEAAWESPLALEGHTDFIYGLAWSPGGEVLAAADWSGAAILWSPLTSTRPLQILPGHSAGVRSLAWSPDGLQLASGGEDGSIRVWGAPVTPPIHTMTIPTPQASSGLPDWSRQPVTSANAQSLAPLAALGRGTVRDMAISPDGSLAAVASGSRVWLYDPLTWQLLSSLPFPNNGEVAGIAWSPDGSKLAATGEIHRVWLPLDIVRTAIWDTATWQTQTVLEEPSGGVALAATPADLAFSADSQWLLTPYGYELIEWNLSTAQTRREMSTESIEWPVVFSLALTPAGDRAVVSGGTFEGEGILILWDVVAGQILSSAVTCSSDILSIDLSPDGKRLAIVCAMEGLQIWRLEGDTLVREEQFVSPQPYRALDTAWSPDGSQVLLSGLGDDPDAGASGQVWVLDGSSGQVQQTYTLHSSPVAVVAWLPGGRQFVAASEDGGLQVFDNAALSHQPITDDQLSVSDIASLSWLPDSAQLVTVSDHGTARLWEIASGEIVARQQADVIALGDSTGLYSAAVSPDGRYAAVGKGNSAIQVIELSTGKITREFIVEIPSSIDSLAWSPDGAYLAGGSYQRIQIWDFQSGELRLAMDVAGTRFGCLAWSPDGTRLAAGEQATAYVRAWQVGDALAAGATTAPQVFRAAANDANQSLAWSPDGSRLAVGGYNDSLGSTSWLRVKIFNRDGSLLKNLEVDSYWGAATSLAWSPDGSLLAAGSESGGLVVWDTASWELRAAFYYAHAPHPSNWRGVTALAWSPDGALLASAGGDGVVRIWGMP